MKNIRPINIIVRMIPPFIKFNVAIPQPLYFTATNKAIITNNIPKITFTRPFNALILIPP